MQQLDLFGLHTDVTKDRPRRKNFEWAKPMKLEECNGICYLCCEIIEGTFALDHIIPVSRGGADELHNLKPAHLWCNQIKADRMPDDPELPGLIGKAVLLASKNISDRVCVQCHTNPIVGKYANAYLCDACVAANRKAGKQDERIRNRNRYSERSREYYRRNSERVVANTRMQRARYPDERKKYDRAYRERNREKIRKRNREWVRAKRAEQRKEKNNV